jgi:hypothetical protein
MLGQIGALLALAGMMIAMFGAPIMAWVRWRRGDPASLDDGPRALPERLRDAIFAGLLPGWALGLGLMLLGTYLR